MIRIRIRKHQFISWGFLCFFLLSIVGACDWNPTDSTDNNDEKLKPFNFKLHGLNFGPYIKGQDPTIGDKISEEQLTELLENIRPYTNWIRTFGSINGLENTGRIAHSLGLKTAIGAWLSSDPTANAIEISNLIAQANAGYVDMAIVGSEVLVRGDLTETELLSYIQQVRNAIPDSIPITTAELCEVLLNHPLVVSAIDVVFVNHYPYWKGIKIDCAISALHACHQRLAKLAGNKPAVVSETGWPSCGSTVGNAVPSSENASRYFLNFISWARANNVPSFYSEAYDERWKIRFEGLQGACWGILDEDGNLKTGMKTIFEGGTVPDNWSDISIPGGPGRPTIVFTKVPRFRSFENLRGEVWHVRPPEYKVVVYILVSSRWWIKPFFNRPLTTIDCDGSWTTDITTGGIDERATRIAAFLVPDGYNPPLAAGWRSLPEELHQIAVAKTEVKRTRP